MSNEAEYRAQAARLRVLADTSGDFGCRSVLRETAEHWQVLADAEAPGERPTRWSHLTQAEQDAAAAVVVDGATEPVRP